jgi:hypothetical protein
MKINCTFQGTILYVLPVRGHNGDVLESGLVYLLRKRNYAFVKLNCENSPSSYDLSPFFRTDNSPPKTKTARLRQRKASQPKLCPVKIKGAEVESMRRAPSKHANRTIVRLFCGFSSMKYPLLDLLIFKA